MVKKKGSKGKKAGMKSAGKSVKKKSASKKSSVSVSFPTKYHYMSRPGKYNVELISAGIFGIIALLHAWRFVSGADLMVDGVLVPQWFSAVIVVVSVWMAVWCYNARGKHY